MLNVALLKAIAEKLIPGIPEETRVAILQQTEVDGSKAEETLPDISSSQTKNADRPVIEEVIERATEMSEVQKHIESQLYARHPMYYHRSAYYSQS